MKIIYNYAKRELPVGFVRLDYIESTGTQWIDTGVKGTDVEYFEYEVSTDKEINIGARLGAGLSAYNVNIRKTYNDIAYAAGNYGTITPPTFNYNDIANRHIYRFGIDGKFYIDNQLYATFPLNQISLPDLNFYLLSFNNGGVPLTGDLYGGKLYSCKIYDNNILVRNFIPCYRFSDGIEGLYDTVGKQFYTNQGTGRFLRGNIIDGGILNNGN